MVDEVAPRLSFKQKIDRWMINEGSRRMYPSLSYIELTCRFVVVFILLHVMVYAFGFMNYSMKVTTPLFNFVLTTGQLDTSTCLVWHHLPHRSSRRIDPPRRHSPHPLP